MIAVRSVLFAIIASLVTAVYGLAVIPGSLLSHKIGYACARSWGRQIVRLAKYICGINYEVRGLETLPTTP